MGACAAAVRLRLVMRLRPDIGTRALYLSGVIACTCLTEVAAELQAENPTGKYLTHLTHLKAAAAPDAADA